MLNSGVVNGNIVNGASRATFEGIIATFKQVVNFTLITEKSTSSYNDYGYNTFLYNGSEPASYYPIVTFNQIVGVIFSGDVVVFKQDVRFRSTYTDGPFAEFQQIVNYTIDESNIIRFRQRVYNA